MVADFDSHSSVRYCQDQTCLMLVSSIHRVWLSIVKQGKVLVVRECPHQLHGQILGQLPLVSTDLRSVLMATVLSLSSETGTEYKVLKVFNVCCFNINCHETLLLS